MNQIARQGKEILAIIEKYEVPYELHAALWAAYRGWCRNGILEGIRTYTDQTQ